MLRLISNKQVRYEQTCGINPTWSFAYADLSNKLGINRTSSPDVFPTSDDKQPGTTIRSTNNKDADGR